MGTSDVIPADMIGSGYPTLSDFYRAKSLLDAALRAYTHENTHPDCRPEMRWRAIMPSGGPRHFGTQEEAVQAILEAVREARR